MRGQLTLFTLYQSPSDYPCKLVVRRWTVGLDPPAKPGEPTPDPNPSIVTPLTMQNYMAIYSLMYQLGLTWLERQRADDPTIVGVFL